MKVWKKRMTVIGGIAAIALLMQGCTPEQQAFAAGAAMGGIAGAALASYDHPHYYDRPYYYYEGRYYYGGYYRDGCYRYHNRCLRGGHYYRDGYRYYNGRRYRAVAGRYGYYPSRSHYERHRNRHRRYR
jgi:hypothetical protein